MGKNLSDREVLFRGPGQAIGCFGTNLYADQNPQDIGRPGSSTRDIASKPHSMSRRCRTIRPGYLFLFEILLNRIHTVHPEAKTHEHSFSNHTSMPLSFTLPMIRSRLSWFIWLWPHFTQEKEGMGTPQHLCRDRHQSGLFSIVDWKRVLPQSGIHCTFFIFSKAKAFNFSTDKNH